MGLAPSRASGSDIRMGFRPRLVPAFCAAILSVATAVGQEPVDFVTQVKPILEGHCFRCHGGEKTEGELSMASRANLFHDDEAMWSVIPKDPDGSVLYERVTLDDGDPDLMPEGGPRLGDAELEVLRRWITEGAPWPEGVELEGEAPPPVDVIEVPPMEEAVAASVAGVLDELQREGAVAQRVAETTEAVDVSFAVLGKTAGDAWVARLAPLGPALVWLNLSRTAVSDQGLEVVGQLPHLRRLHLANTAVTDAGLAHLASLGELEFLNLYGTATTDAGLKHLHGLEGLRKLYLWQTQVTDAGVAALAAARPDLHIDRGDYRPVPAEPRPEPANETCPVTDKPLPDGDPGQFAVLHRGQWVGFCCAKCRAAFEADPKKYEDKLPKTGLEVVNDVCPVSGEKADASITVDHDGRRVAFCCANCKVKFEADPAPYLAVLDAKPALGPELNEVCPVSGQPAKPQIFVDDEGLRVAFCCEKCKAKFEADPAAYRAKIDHPGQAKNKK